MIPGDGVTDPLYVGLLRLVFADRAVVCLPTLDEDGDPFVAVAHYGVDMEDIAQLAWEGGQPAMDYFVLGVAHRTREKLDIPLPSVPHGA